MRASFDMQIAMKHNKNRLQSIADAVAFSAVREVTSETNWEDRR